ncbi:MAG: cysteine peptidase family C39 domain-containing protein [Candidatus Pacearchaeota archaeon]|jgi:ABC-type bacteriocin/lantibiotic exporter with double-glycine peptidase domain
MNLKPIMQEHTAGCGIACTASILNINYKKALKFFNKKYVSRRGYYCNEIVKALNKNGLNYQYVKVNNKTKKFLQKPGTIVFVERSKKYDIGHYVLKTNKGWMNPWVNYPNLNPVNAGFEKKLPGKAQWIIYKV